MRTNLKKITLPVGYQEFHPVPHINFQINRWYCSGGYDFETAKEAGEKIKDFDDWKRIWIELGEKADKNGDIRKAGFCYRAAEFFVAPQDPDKTRLYDMFVERFYQYHKDEGFQRIEVPYKNGKLPCLRLTPENPKGTFVFHGGGDSFIEEFYPYLVYMYKRGYDTIIFEGPGQGAVIHKHNLGFEWQWEHPAKAVLDYFNIEECAFMGISFGGWFCVRAAAFEPRIKKLVVWNALSQVKKSFLLSMPEAYRNIYVSMMENEDKEGFIAMKARAAEGNSFVQWLDNNTMFAYGKDNVYDGYRCYDYYTPENQCMDRIIADVFLTTCEEDHFVLREDNDLMREKMINARSIETRYFTAEEQAGHHCCVGNVQLGITAIADWLDSH